MRRIHNFTWAVTGIAFLASTSAPLLFAHGGTYIGPTDTVPPVGAPTGPVSGPPGPNVPGVGPQSGNPNAPGVPGGYNPLSGNPANPSGPVSGPKGPVIESFTSWVYWWELNKAQYLNLKASVFSDPGVATGSDDEFINPHRNRSRREVLRPTESQIRGVVVPAIRKALEEETNNDIVTGCLIALGKIGGDADFVPLIQSHLASKNQEISETAAVALGILADPAGLETLVHLMQDDEKGRELVNRGEVNYRTRGFAAYGVGLIGAYSQNSGVKANCVSILRETLANPKASYRDVRVACVVSLGMVRDPELKGIEDLRRVLAKDEIDKGGVVRAHAAMSLAKLIGSDHPLRSEFAKQLNTVLDERKENQFVRQSAVYALGLVSKPLTVGDEVYELGSKTVERCIKETNNEEEKRFGLIALGKMGGEEAQNFLVQQMSKPQAELKPWAALGLGILGRKQIESGQSVSKIVYESVRTLFAETKDGQKRGASAIALGMLKDQESADLILAGLKSSSDEEFRGYCCLALGMIGAREKLPEIQKIVEESSRKPDLMRQAAIGLGLLGDKRLVDYLVEMLKDPKRQTLAVQAAISSALGFIGDQRSIDPLIEVLGNKALADTSRSFGCVALGLICDKEMLPWNSKISADLNYLAATTTLSDHSGSTGIVDIL